MRRAAALYALLAIASYTPQSLSPWNTVAYVGDPLANAYVVAWNAHQLVRQPLHVFDTNVLYPHKAALAFDEHRILPSLLVAPIVWTTGNSILAYNVALLLASLLLALATRHLALRLGLGALAAFTAGALNAFHTYQVNEFARLQIVFHGFIPLALAGFVSFLQSGERRAAWRTGAFLLMQGFCCAYYLLYGALLFVTLALIALCAQPRATLAKLPRLLLPAVVCALPLVPMGAVYARSAAIYGYERAPPRGIDLEHYVSTSPRNLLYGPIGAEVRLQQRGPHFIGFFALALGALGLTRLRQTSGRERLPARVWVPAAALLALGFALLSLGSVLSAFGRTLGPGPYRLLYDFVPGFRLVGIPERLSLFAMLFISLLAARGVDLLARGGYGLVALVCAALVPLEHLGPLPLSQRIPVGSEIAPVYRWLAGNPVRAVTELPIHGEGFVRRETLEMYASTFHWKPTVQGYVTYDPLLSKVLRRQSGDFPSPLSLQALARVGVDTVVVHHDPDAALRLFESVRPRYREALARSLDLRAPFLGNAVAKAVAEGTIRLAASLPHPAFGDDPAHRDEVYRVEAPAVREPAALEPRGRRLREPTWRYSSLYGRAAQAGDGDPTTAWEVRRPLQGDEWIEVAFGRDAPVSGIALPMRRSAAFPTVFVVEGLLATGEWKELARLGPGQVLQIVDQLLQNPGMARMSFAFETATLRGIRLALAPGASSFDGWAVDEIEVLTP